MVVLLASIAKLIESGTGKDLELEEQESRGSEDDVGKEEFVLLLQRLQRLLQRHKAHELA